MTDVPASRHLPCDTGSGGRHGGWLMVKIGGNDTRLKNGRRLKAANDAVDTVVISVSAIVFARRAD